MNDITLASSKGLSLPEQIRTRITPVLFSENKHTAKKFWEFFGVTLRNVNTRNAYMRACFQFANWIDERGIELVDVEPMMVAAYVEHLNEQYSAPTVKLQLTAIRRLFGWLVINQVVSYNPCSDVQSPRHSVKIGKTPVLTTEEMRHLFESIELNGPQAYRDRAVIAVMAYSFARVSAVCKLNGSDYYTQSKRSYFILQEKNGLQNKVPAHHTAQQYMDEYLQNAPLPLEANEPLFQTMTKNVKYYTGSRMNASSVFRMVKRRCRNAGLPPEICNHSFRGTGITNYMQNGGTLETAARIAGHASTTTTQLYDRRSEELTLDEIERIRY